MTERLAELVARARTLPEEELMSWWEALVVEVTVVRQADGFVAVWAYLEELLGLLPEELREQALEGVPMAKLVSAAMLQSPDKAAFIESMIAALPEEDRAEGRAYIERISQEAAARAARR